MTTLDPGRVVVFNHIPKTAGSSVRDVVRSAMGAERAVYCIDQSLVGGYVDFSALATSVRPQFVFSPDEMPDADFVSGHISPGTTKVRYPHARHITILRNPQTRVISQWVHGRSLTDLELRHWGTALAFRAARWPLQRYLNDDMLAPNVDNTIARFLTWPHAAVAQDAFVTESEDDALFDSAVATLDGFTHVNVVENEGFMKQLGADLGIALIEKRLNDRTANPPVVATDLAAELDPATRELLEYRTRIDRRIWLHVAHKVLPGVDHAAILATTLDDSVRRYGALPARRPAGNLVRRTAETVYRAKARIDPRLRGYR